MLLESRKEMPDMEVSLQFWPEYLGHFGLPIIIVDKKRGAKAIDYV